MNSPPFLLTFGQMVPWWFVWNPVDMCSSASPRKFQNDLQGNIPHKTSLHVHCMLEKHTTSNSQCSPILKLFLGAIYSPHQLDMNRQKSDSTSWKWNRPRAFPKDQGRLFVTKCCIRWVLKYKGSRGSLGKLIHFPILSISIWSFLSLPWQEEDDWEGTQKSSSKCLSPFPSGVMTSRFPHTCSATMCTHVQGFWPTSKPLIFTLAELKKIWKADKENPETPDMWNRSNCKCSNVI